VSSALGGRVPLACELGWLLTHGNSAEGALKRAMVLPRRTTGRAAHGNCAPTNGEEVLLVKAETVQRSGLSDDKREDGEDARHQQYRDQNLMEHQR
jgi:hypothetical protein